MSDQTLPAGEQRVDYDPEHVIARLQRRLGEIIGDPAAAVEVEAARLEAIVRSLAGQAATQQAQLDELQNPAGKARASA